MISLTLSPADIIRADKIALLRQTVAEHYHRLGKNGAAAVGTAALNLNIKGARAEHAFRNFVRGLGYKWNWFMENIYNIPDFEHAARLPVDVKAISARHHKLLIQHDDPDWVYVLVDASQHPTYHIRGCIKGCDAKQKQWWADPVGGRPAYFVPQVALQGWGVYD